MNKLYFYIGIVLVAIIVLGGGWYLLFGGSSANTPTTPGVNFGVGEERPVTVPEASSSVNEPVGTDGTGVATKVFKIVDGPVAGAALMLVGHPTTTVARFVMQDSGHVFDLPLDSPGSITRAVSNTTVPGIVNTVWEEQGSGVTLQYVDNNVVKTLHLGFPAATSTLGQQQAVKVQFLPNGITSFAVSPDNKNVVYLLKSASGSDGYIANVDGTASKKLFSLPLSQLIVSWPSTGTILAQSNSEAGVPGIVFSIDSKSGANVPLIYATGITAMADRTFSKIIYQTTAASSNSHTTYVRDTKRGLSNALTFDPYPERCIWSYLYTTVIYCAVPLAYVPANYLDQWHAGTASAADSIFAYDVSRGATHIIAAPGSSDGGEQADIASMALSADEKYLVFIRKGDRSLWGVRLTQ